MMPSRIKLPKGANKSESIILDERRAVSSVEIGKIMTPNITRIPPNVPSIDFETSSMKNKYKIYYDLNVGKL